MNAPWAFALANSLSAGIAKSTWIVWPSENTMRLTSASLSLSLGIPIQELPIRRRTTLIPLMLMVRLDI